MRERGACGKPFAQCQCISKNAVTLAQSIVEPDVQHLFAPYRPIGVEAFGGVPTTDNARRARAVAYIAIRKPTRVNKNASLLPAVP